MLDVSCKIMRSFITISFFLFSISANAQRFDSLQIDKLLLSIPYQYDQDNQNENIIKAIQAVDKKYKEISDTLYTYKSLKHTLFQTIPIKTRYLLSTEKAFLKVISDTIRYPISVITLKTFQNDTMKFLNYYLQVDQTSYPRNKFPIDSIEIYPSSLGNKLSTKDIFFENKLMNFQIDSIAKRLNNSERDKLFNYLNNNYDYFSLDDKKMKAKSVRIRYITFGENELIYVGIDIYGQHFLWTIDKSQNWDIIKVEDLWIY